MTSDDLRMSEVRVEVMTITDGMIQGEPVNVVAIGYPHDRHDLELTFRAAEALFDTEIEGMSAKMKVLVQSAYHRVAILELK